MKGLRKFQEEQAAKQGIALPPGDGRLWSKTGRCGPFLYPEIDRVPTAGR